MNQSQINNAISSALANLYETNEMLHDYWLSELWGEDNNPIGEMWTENTVNLMEKEILAVENFQN